MSTLAEELSRSLKAIGACEEAVVWAKDYKTPRSAWKVCKRGNWMLWVCGKMEGRKGWPTRQQIVLVACDCAELALPIYEKKHPNDKRVRECIEVTRKWANGKATIEEVRRAQSAVDAAAYSDAAAAAYSAADADADAAAYSAAAAADAAAAAYSAADADAAAYSAAAAADAAAYSAAAAAADAAVADAAAYSAAAADATAARLRIQMQCADFCRKGLTIPASLPHNDGLKEAK